MAANSLNSVQIEIRSTMLRVIFFCRAIVEPSGARVDMAGQALDVLEEIG